MELMIQLRARAPGSDRHDHGQERDPLGQGAEDPFSLSVDGYRIDGHRGHGPAGEDVLPRNSRTLAPVRTPALSSRPQIQSPARLIRISSCASCRSSCSPPCPSPPSRNRPAPSAAPCRLPGASRPGLKAGTRDSTGRPGARYWQLGTDYKIDVRLDQQTGRLTGREVVTIRNPSDSAIKLLVIRLYQNRFDPMSPRSRVPPSVTSGQTLYKVVVDGADIDTKAPAATWTTGTLVTIPLKQPIAAGGTSTVEIEWAGDIPDIPIGRGAARGGRRGLRVFQPTQWYPRVAKYDDLRGWDREPYLGRREFYNNFGRFDVSIDVPAGWIVSGTGVLQNPEEVLTATARERLSQVLESDSQRHDRRARTRRAPGRRPRARQPARLALHRRHGERLRVGHGEEVRVGGDARDDSRQGCRPDPHVVPAGRATLYAQDRRDHASRARVLLGALVPVSRSRSSRQDGPSAGMEYPMVINSNQGAADHETGHQWWPMMVGNNETWYGWMDEGFNQYMNILSERCREAEADDPRRPRPGSTAASAATKPSRR